MKILGNKIYDVCNDCGKIVQLNKHFLGSLHLCPEIMGTTEQKNHYKNVTITWIKKEFENS